MLRNLLKILPVAFVLAACETTPPETAPRDCPPLADWTIEESSVLADEIEEYAWQTPYMYRATREYFTLRRQCE